MLGLCGIVGASILAVPRSWLALLGLIPLTMGIRAGILLLRHRGDDRSVPAAAGFFSSMGVTLAISGDNVAVYLPILATSNLSGALGSLAIWLLLDLGLVALAGWLGRHPILRRRVEHIGPALLPLVYVAVGIVVLARA